MRLDIDDGYTLKAETEPVRGVSVRFKYRPALPEAVADWRLKTQRAQTGKDEVTAAAELLANHLVEWDVTNKGEAVPIKSEYLARVPEPILNHLIRAVISWAPRADAERGNS